MRNVPVPAKLLGFVLLVCCLQASRSASLSDETPLKLTNDDNPQIEDEMSKRDWNKDLHIWGKRGWDRLHEGWGRKRSVPAASWNDQMDKRAWQNLHSGWGKRFSPDEENVLRQLISSSSDQYEYGPELVEPSDANNEEEKRSWGQIHGDWGKRSKWDNFRGSWGKREPSWPQLRGMWGKRSD